MAWYDSAVETINGAWESVTDYAGEYVDAVKQSKLFEIQQSSNQQQPRPDATDSTSAQPQAVNWQKWGVIAGAAGVALTVYKLVK